jgi:hypothetical protein
MRAGCLRVNLLFYDKEKEMEEMKRLTEALL